MDERVDTAAKALVALLMSGCDATLSALAPVAGRLQPLRVPERPAAAPVRRAPPR